MVSGVAYCVTLVAVTFASLDIYGHNAAVVAEFRASGQPSLASFVVSDNLGAAVVMLVVLPALGLAAGVAGAVGAAAVSRRAVPGS